jgi:hypothetical protein
MYRTSARKENPANQAKKVKVASGGRSNDVSVEA